MGGAAMGGAAMGGAAMGRAAMGGAAMGGAAMGGADTLSRISCISEHSCACTARIACVSPNVFKRPFN